MVINLWAIGELVPVVLAMVMTQCAMNGKVFAKFRDSSVGD
jgi:hypothetical protein